MSTRFFILFAIFLLPSCLVSQTDIQLYDGQGYVEFVSEAPLETIGAKTTALVGLLDLENMTFAFSVPITSFEGFNSPLQKEHFNEHYLESELYPNSTFTGKILDFSPCTKNCSQFIKAKGKFQIHGVTKIVTIPIELIYNHTSKSFTANSLFILELDEYDISIPLLLEAKISSEIMVTVSVDFTIQNE